MPCVGLRERGQGFGADASVVVAGEMAGFGIFLHVLPEALHQRARRVHLGRRDCRVIHIFQNDRGLAYVLNNSRGIAPFCDGHHILHYMFV